MASIGYQDFDLQIRRDGNRYRAQVLNASGGQAGCIFDAPLSDLELENFFLRVGRVRNAVRRAESPEVEAVKIIGDRLFRSVFQDELFLCFRSSLEEADRAGKGLRIRLHLTEVPELADVPWEFLYYRNMNRFLALSDETPVVRYLDFPERIRPLEFAPPLRVLVVISSPTDFATLQVEEEWTRLRDSLAELEKAGLVQLVRLEDSSVQSLQRRLRKEEFHVLHFVGHGAFDRNSEDGFLIFEDPQKRGWKVSGQDLGMLLHDHRSMRLAVLNACEGARGSRTDPFAGTAQSLVQQGIPAVVAMQFEISDDAAITFAQEFYQALADNYPVDGALAEARKAIFSRGPGPEWGTPVLYLRAPDGRIFDIKRISAEDRKSVQVAALRSAAQAAMSPEGCETAIERLTALLAIAPDDAEAQAQLRKARGWQRLAAIYARAQAAYGQKRWHEAMSECQEILSVDDQYRDAQSLLDSCKRNLREEAENRERQERDREEQRRTEWERSEAQARAARTAAPTTSAAAAPAPAIIAPPPPYVAPAAPPRKRSAFGLVVKVVVYSLAALFVLGVIINLADSGKQVQEQKTGNTYSAPAETPGSSAATTESSPTPTTPPNNARVDEAPPSSTPARQTIDVDTILNRYVDALGGRDAIFRNTSRVTQGSLTMMGFTLPVTIYETVPNKTATDITMPNGTHVLEGFDGTRGWELSAASGFREKRGAELVQARLDADFYGDVDLRRTFQNFELRGTEQLPSGLAYVVEASRGRGAIRIFYFDVNSGLLTRTRGVTFNEGKPEKVVIDISDYRGVDGMMLPFRHRAQSSAGIVEIQINSITHNMAIPDTVFAVPE